MSIHVYVEEKHTQKEWWFETQFNVTRKRKLSILDSTRKKKRDPELQKKTGNVTRVKQQ